MRFDYTRRQGTNAGAVRIIVAAGKPHIENKTDSIKRLDEQVRIVRLRGESYYNTERIELI